MARECAAPWRKTPPTTTEFMPFHQTPAQTTEEIQRTVRGVLANVRQSNARRKAAGEPPARKPSKSPLTPKQLPSSG